MSDIDYDLLCKVIETGNLEPVMEAHFRPEYCEDEQNQKVWTWVFRYNAEYGSCPTAEALRREFPSYTLDIPLEEPYQYLIDEMLRRRKFVIVHQSVEDIRAPMSEQDPDTALKILATAVERAGVEASSARDEDLTETAQHRMERYMKMPKGLLGIPTGFATMDFVTSGLQKEQLVSLVGPPKRMKSAILTHMAMHANLAGYRILLVTFEMSTDEMSMRHDAFRAGVGFRRLQNGKLTQDERAKMRKALKKMEGMRPMVFVHDPASVTTVSALASKISQYKPDAVYVDGAYLMDSATNADPGSPQALTQITRSMKRLAQRSEVPIVVTTQALLSKMRGKKVGLDSIGWTSSFAQDSDVVFAVEETEDEMEMLLRIIAARNTSRQDIRLRVDWEKGEIIEMDPEIPDEEREREHEWEWEEDD